MTESKVTWHRQHLFEKAWTTRVIVSCMWTFLFSTEMAFLRWIKCYRTELNCVETVELDNRNSYSLVFNSPTIQCLYVALATRWSDPRVCPSSSAAPRHFKGLRTHAKGLLVTSQSRWGLPRVVPVEGSVSPIRTSVHCLIRPNAHCFIRASAWT